MQAPDVSDEYANQEILLPRLYSTSYWEEYSEIIGFDSSLSGYPGYEDTAQKMIDQGKRDKQIMAAEEVQRIVKKHQNPVTALCQVMKAIWYLISKENTEAAAGILSNYLTIDNRKQTRQFEVAYEPVVCPKCKASQLRFALSEIPCHSCSEPLTLNLLPGLLIAEPGTEDPAASFSPKKRKLEHVYTLFEALFACAGLAFGINFDDLSLEISKTLTRDKQESINSVCPFCHRPLKLTTFAKSKCMYCGRPVSSDPLDLYL